MGDLIPKLRAEIMNPLPHVNAHRLLKSAADEIERLRAALVEIAESDGLDPDCNGLINIAATVLSTTEENNDE